MALALLAGLAAGGEAGAAERSGKVGDAVLRLIDADVSDRATGALAMLGVTAGCWKAQTASVPTAATTRA